MPEIHFRIRWPDQSETRCYSPSTTIMQFLTADRSYPLSEFLGLSRKALHRTALNQRSRIRPGPKNLKALGKRFLTSGL